MKRGVGSKRFLMNSDIFSESSFMFSRPRISPLSPTPKNKEPPVPLAKADTVFNQLLGFLVSNDDLNS